MTSDDETEVLPDKASTQDWVIKKCESLHRPCLIELCGPMGAGKTQLAQWIIEKLGGHFPSSPTFAIHQVYDSPGGPIDHLDLYRLRDMNELLEIGFTDLLENPSVLVIVEWADRLEEGIWPKTWQRVRFDIQPAAGSADAREINFQLN
ncbi:MAG: tRNA (adenosine(37)-N6)-threonylcarbamoyltransferase complex ATPase subunit type 1 TsaE [Bdellovibrionales bacterium]